MNLFGFKFGEAECGGCNWRVSNLYVLARDKKEARNLIKKEHLGLCGECICDMLASECYEIELPKKVKKNLPDEKRRG